MYLYSALDETANSDSMASSPSPLVAPNPKPGKSEGPDTSNIASRSPVNWMDIDDEITPASTMQQGVNPLGVVHQDSDRVSDDNSDGDGGDDDAIEAFTPDFFAAEEDGFQPDVPVIYPRQSYSGALNVRTIKDG